MQSFSDVFWQVLDIAGEMSPYLLLGFLLAGLMHAFIPGAMYSRYLAGGSFRSVFYAALFGVPLPLCSCGVIPTAMSLRREGASKGAAVSFLIATPQTGVDSIIATYSLMGLPFAIVRPIAALLTALFGGQMVNWVEKKELAGVNGSKKELADDTKKRPLTPANSPLTPANSLFLKTKEALRYAFVEMMEDIGKWLVIGLVVAGLITALVPDSFFAVFRDNTLLSMLLVLAIAIPMYICATGSIPIAVALMMKGLTPGAALVMLMAGPACNVASILVINKVLGRKTLLTYLASIILGSIAFGTAIDHLLPTSLFVPKLQAAACCHHAAQGMPWFNIACTVLLIALLLNAIFQHYRHPHCHCHGTAAAGEICQTASVARLDFKIKGMSCNHCRNNALRALESLESVAAADVDLATGRAFVEGEATMEQIKATIDSLGYTVEEL